MVLHDLIVQELVNTKSLAALIFLIERGRELEFSYNGREYFISRSRAQRFVSLWDRQNEQSFDSVEELIGNAVIGNQSLMSVWKDVNIETLF